MEVSSHREKAYREYRCDFCPLDFRASSEKTVHIYSHFEQRICQDCDRNMLRIGDGWYVLHATITCISSMNSELIDESEPHQIQWQCVDSVESTKKPIGSNDVDLLNCDQSIKQVTEIDSKENTFVDESSDNPTHFETENCFDDSDDSLDELDNTVEENDKIEDASELATKEEPSRDKRKRNENNKKERSAETEKTKKFGKDLYSCEICDRSFKRRDYLTSHNKHVHSSASDKKFKCDHCPSGFITKSKLERHLRQGGTCEKCGQTFCLKPALQSHQHFCNGEISEQKPQKFQPIGAFNSFECDICKKVFQKKASIKNHLLQVHCESLRTIKCDICGFACFSNSILKSHIRNRHSKETDKNLICSECGKTFLQPYLLRLHTYTHTNQKPYECKFEGCSKRYNSQSHRLAHMRTHTGDLPYLCSAEGCNERFQTFRGRKRHEFRLHYIYAKKYSCHICSHEFLESQYLKKHLKTHGKI